MIKKIAVNTVMAVGAILVIGYVGGYFMDNLMTPSGMKKAESIFDEVERKKNGSLSERDCKFILTECVKCAYPNGFPSNQAQEKEETVAQKF